MHCFHFLHVELLQVLCLVQMLVLSLEFLYYGFWLVRTQYSRLLHLGAVRAIEVWGADVSYAFSVKCVVLFAHDSTFPPGCFWSFRVGDGAGHLMFFVDVPKILLDLILFLNEVFLEF